MHTFYRVDSHCIDFIIKHILNSEWRNEEKNGFVKVERIKKSHINKRIPTRYSTAREARCWDRMLNSHIESTAAILTYTYICVSIGWCCKVNRPQRIHPPTRELLHPQRHCQRAQLPPSPPPCHQPDYLNDSVSKKELLTGTLLLIRTLELTLADLGFLAVYFPFSSWPRLLNTFNIEKIIFR